MRSRIWMICGLLCLMLPPGSRAEWLGLMQNQSGGAEIDSPLDSREISLAFDAGNNAVCIVTQLTTPSYYRLLETRQAYGGNNWSPASAMITIDNRNIVGGVQDPGVSLLPGGAGMCVYAQYDNTTFRYRIYGDAFNQDFAIVNNSAPLDTGTPFNAVQPSVAMLSAQAGVLAFVQSTSGGYNRIFASKWENSAWSCWSSTGWTTLGSMVPIDGPEALNGSHPHLALSTDGDIYGVFSREGADKGIYAARYHGGQWYYWGVGGWVSIASTGISYPISQSGQDADFPRLAALPQGQMLCVYQLQNKADGNSRIHASLYNGTSWIADPGAAPVDTAANTVAAVYPDVAANSQGKVICVYAKGNTADAVRHVYASAWDGAHWSSMNAQAPLDTLGNSVTAMTPKIACDTLGNAISVFQVWEASAGVGGQCRVMANYFQGPPQVTTVSPDSANNTGKVTLTVQGSNFAGGSTAAQRVNAWLVQAGKPNLTGSNITVATSTQNFFTASQFTVDFDLTNAPVGDWDLVVQNPDGQSCTVAHALGVTWPDLNQAYVYPNPIRYGGSGLQGADHLRFFNLMHTTTVRIYTIDGVLLRSLNKEDRTLFVDWDLKNSKGALVAPGVYFYLLESTTGNRKGKFMVIR